MLVTDRDAYQALFNGVTDETSVGEASVLYLYTPMASVRIKHYIPEVKLIAILRNPVDRAFSSFLHLRRDGREQLTDFAEALQAEEARVKANWEHLWHYTRLGFYYTQLKPYFDLFHPDQIAMYTYNEFRANPIKLVQDIFGFLDVDSTFVPDTSIRYEVSGTPKSRALHAFLITPSMSKTILKSFFPAPLRLRLSRMTMQWNVDPAKPELLEETRRYLIQLFRDEILKLQSLIQRDLSKWLEA